MDLLEDGGDEDRYMQGQSAVSFSSTSVSLRNRTEAGVRRANLPNQTFGLGAQLCYALGKSATHYSVFPGVPCVRTLHRLFICRHHLNLLTVDGRLHAFYGALQYSTEH